MGRDLCSEQSIPGGRGKIKDSESRLMWSEGIARPIPRSVRSVHVKIARKIHASRRQKKKLAGLYEVLAPSSTVRKISPTTSITKEPIKPEFRVRNSDTAKFGTKIERGTELGQYIERRTKKNSRENTRLNDYKSSKGFRPQKPG